MSMLSDDDLNLKDMSDEELERAWDLWFDLAQATNAWDPPYEHGVFVGLGLDATEPRRPEPEAQSPKPTGPAPPRTPRSRSASPR